MAVLTSYSRHSESLVNDNLEATAQEIFNHEMQEKCNLLAPKKIKDLGTVITGKTPPTDYTDYYGNDVPFIKTPDMHGTPFVTKSDCWLSKLGADSQSSKYIPAFSLIVACIGANAGEVAITTYKAQTNQQINSVITRYPYFLYFSFKKYREDFRALGDGSSTMLNINKTLFDNFEVMIPNWEKLSSIEHTLSCILKPAYDNQVEIDKLELTQQWIISKLSR